MRGLAHHESSRQTQAASLGQRGRRLRRCAVNRLLSWIAPETAASVLLTVLVPGYPTCEAASDSAAGLQVPAGVRLDVTVVDDVGRPVRGLRTEDFVVEEDGLRQQVETVTAVAPVAAPPRLPWAHSRVSSNIDATASATRTVALVIDDAAMTPGMAQSARTAAAELLDRLGPEDRVGVYATSARVWCSGQIPAQREPLRAALQLVVGERAARMAESEYVSEHEAALVVERGDATVIERIEARIAKAPRSLLGPLGRALGMTDGTSDATSVPGTGAGDGGSGAGFGSSFGDPAGIGAFSRYGRSAESADGRAAVKALARRVYDASRQRRARFDAVLRRAVAALAPAEGQRSLLVLAAGLVHVPDDPSHAGIAEAVRRADVGLYIVDLASGGEHGAVDRADLAAQGHEKTPVPQHGPDLGTENQVLASLDALGRDANATLAIERMLAGACDYYTLGYHSRRDATDGAFRSVSVSVTRPNATVRFRSRDSPMRKASVTETTRDQASVAWWREALDSPVTFGGIGLRMSSHALERVSEGRVRTLLASELRLDDLGFRREADHLVADVDVLFSVTHYASGQVFGDTLATLQLTAQDDAQARNAWHLVLQDVTLPPGPALARLVVRDRTSGQIGSVAQLIDVPAESEWRVSSPILSGVAVRERDGTAERAMPVAHRTFVRGGMLYCEFEVYTADGRGAGDISRLSTTYTIVREDGRVERQAESESLGVPRDGRLRRLIALPLRGLKSANHELILQVSDERGQTQTVREPFSLAFPSQPTPEVYRALLREYAERPEPETVAAVLAWRAHDVSAIAEMTVASHAELSRATVMWHTDAALSLMTHGQPADGHLEVARRELDRKLKGTDFERDWLLAIGAELQITGHIRKALTYYAKCQHRFPNAAAAWVAAGAVREADAFPQGHGPGRLVQPGSTASREAERDYRKAIALDPALDEARLRLGRVLLGAERHGEALAELQRVARREPGDRIAALARLLLGDALEQLGRAEEAFAQYRAALQVDPQLQPAAAAIGELLRRRRDEAGAVDALKTSLARPLEPGPGAWSTYRMGWGAHAATLLESLRRQAREAAVAQAGSTRQDAQ